MSKIWRLLHFYAEVYIQVLSFVKIFCSSWQDEGNEFVMNFAVNMATKMLHVDSRIVGAFHFDRAAECYIPMTAAILRNCPNMQL